jgi:hypothetical protein
VVHPLVFIICLQVVGWRSADVTSFLRVCLRPCASFDCAYRRFIIRTHRTPLGSPHSYHRTTCRPLLSCSAHPRCQPRSAASFSVDSADETR